MQNKSKNSPTHYSSTEMGTAEKAFREAFPDFNSTSILDELRATEYARLDEQRHIYLDYTGGGLYADCQLRDHMELLRSNVFGNPHSLNPTSRAMTELCDQARASVLKFFNASPDEYTVIFTSNASNALKLVGEAYPFKPEGQFLLLFDNHNSVNGIREFARAKGATITYLPVIPPELRVEDSHLLSFLESRNDTGHQPVRLSGPIKFHRSSASTRMDRRGPCQGLGCTRRLCCICPHESSGPEQMAPRFCAHLVL